MNWAHVFVSGGSRNRSTSAMASTDSFRVWRTTLLWAYDVAFFRPTSNSTEMRQIDSRTWFLALAEKRQAPRHLATTSLAYIMMSVIGCTCLNMSSVVLVVISTCKPSRLDMRCNPPTDKQAIPVLWRPLLVWAFSKILRNRLSQ